jgi:cytochrome c oxidase subunit I
MPIFTWWMLDEPLSKLHFWTTFIGFHLTFLVQHWLGNEGMPRRYVDYLPSDGFTGMHTVSTIGAFCWAPRRCHSSTTCSRVTASAR